MLTRRAFAASSLAALAFGGLARRSWAQDAAESYRNEVPGYGALAADPAVMARTGQVLRVADLAAEYGFTDIDGRRVPPFELDAA